MTDDETIEQFRNFLSWRAAPGKSMRHPTGNTLPFPPIPPAVVAYARGVTPWCPPKGTL